MCRLLLVLMSVIVVVQVFSRYLFNYSFVWAEELVRYLMIWMVMIGAARVQAMGEHIRIDFFPMLAGPRGRRLMDTVFRLCTLTFLIIIFVKGIKIAAFNRLFESSGLRISMLWPTLAIPIGAFLIILYTLKDLVQDIYQSIFWSKEKLLVEDARLLEEKRMSVSEPLPPDPDRS
jgi:C4-dicarboxylate transporter DctQ subunit